MPNLKTGNSTVEASGSVELEGTTGLAELLLPTKSLLGFELLRLVVARAGERSGFGLLELVILGVGKAAAELVVGERLAAEIVLVVDERRLAVGGKS